MIRRIAGGVAIATASYLVAGCAAMTLQSYVGHDLNDAVRRYGMPAESMALPNGTHAFKWIVAATRAPAASAPLETFMPLATAPLQRRQAFARAGALMGGMCVYTLIGTWHPDAGKWIVTRYEPPRIDCA